MSVDPIAETGDIVRRLGPDGLALIKEFEGYHTAQPDGSCVAYLCPAKVPTIGWGCTEGVRLGMRWTEAEATAALQRELLKAERAVNEAVTVYMTQAQYDALVSFTYNVGSGALRRSTLLRKLNRGDYDGAEKEFARWNRGGGRVLRGLSRRRKREAIMFGSGSVDYRVANDPPEHMPQEVTESKTFPTKTVVTAAGTGVGLGVAKVAEQVPHSVWDGGLTIMGQMAQFAQASWQTVAVIGGVTFAMLAAGITGAKK